jgi:hypothetical protein
VAAFDPSTQLVFLWAPALTREQALVAAARVKVKPASLQGPLPICALASRDDDEVRRVLMDASSVNVPAWVVSPATLDRLERVAGVIFTASGVEFVTGQRIRRVPYERLIALADVRWKGTATLRVQVALPDDAAAIVISPDALVVEGPSKQGAILRLQNELAQRVSSSSPNRLRAFQVMPQQLGLDASVPGELVAHAIAEGLRLQGAGRR